MSKEYAALRYEQAAAMLPMRWQAAAMRLSEKEKSQAEELRLRAGQPPTVLLPDGERELNTAIPGEAVEQSELEQLCDRITGYSRYAACDTLRHGYLTAHGGFRIGLCGSAVMQGGANTNLRDLSSAVIRISREMPGVADDLLPQLLREGNFRSTLLYSSPGVGKTTLLRDLIRQLSEGTAFTRPYRVALADERGEIAVMHQGRAQMAIGCHTDVMDACPKAIAIPILLRAANPQIIAVDEITQEEDIRAMAAAANCGVQLLATIHAGSRDELKRKPLFPKLLCTGVFAQCVFISSMDGARQYVVEKLQ